MEYFDMHVKFGFEGYSEAGFRSISVFGRDIEEFDDHKKSGKLTLLESADSDYIKPRIKRCSLIHNPAYELDLGVIRSAAKYETPFEIPVRPILLNSGTGRATLIKRISRFLKTCNKLGAVYVLTSRATNVYEAKYPSELIAIGCALGLSYDQSLRAITEAPKRAMGV